MDNSKKFIPNPMSDWRQRPYWNDKDDNKKHTMKKTGLDNTWVGQSTNLIGRKPNKFSKANGILWIWLLLFLQAILRLWLEMIATIPTHYFKCQDWEKEMLLQNIKY